MHYCFQVQIEMEIFGKYRRYLDLQTAKCVNNRLEEKNIMEVSGNHFLLFQINIPVNLVPTVRKESRIMSDIFIHDILLYNMLCKIIL